MSDKFRNKYRIPSTRLQNWDYGSNAMYFVTICTLGREHFFGPPHRPFHQQNKPLANNGFIISENVPCHRLWDRMNRRFQNMRTVWDSISPGNPGFMTIYLG